MNTKSSIESAGLCGKMHAKDILVNENSFTCDVCSRSLWQRNIKLMAYAGLGVQKICYDCVGRMDAQMMKEGFPVVLYIEIEHTDWPYPIVKSVCNYPKTIRFTPYLVRRSKHNIGGRRHDVWFTGPDGSKWHGVNIGSNQILRCHRLKRQKPKTTNPLPETAYLNPYPYERS